MFCLPVCLCTICILAVRGGQKVASGPLKLELDCCELPCGGWELNLGPLEDPHPVLLTAELSLQSPEKPFLNKLQLYERKKEEKRTSSSVSAEQATGWDRTDPSAGLMPHMPYLKLTDNSHSLHHRAALSVSVFTCRPRGSAFKPFCLLEARADSPV